MEQRLRMLLIDNGQEHLLKIYNRLAPAQQAALCEDLQQIDVHQLRELRALFTKQQTEHPPEPVFAPVPVTRFPPNDPERARCIAIGEEYLRRGRIALFLVAGGQGTRLGFEGPKGCFPITPVKGKPLFQLFAETIRALQHRYQTVLPWYIMTSRDNHALTDAFFKQHQYFGLDPAQVWLCRQQDVPSLDLMGRLILSPEYRIFKNPNGHGGSIQALATSGALADMARRGIDEVFYFQVDNPLVKIADPLFIGVHVDGRAQMSSKVVTKSDPHERVGIIGLINGRLGCIEYSELSPEQAAARTPNGELLFSSANIAIHMINRRFIEQLATDPAVRLPFHCARKNIPALDPETGAPQTICGIKFEMFIFDALGFAQRSCTLAVERDEEFAPVKNRTGPDSPETARAALMRLHRSWLRAAGCDIPESVAVEISPLFALDAEEFSTKFVPPAQWAAPLYIE
ncbi:MAG: UDPGP type 1 family protein [Desulfobacterota bacterium]|nr:UDPGP type 1 family protein [Thermodesulfobacteriota bacterium]